MTQRNDSFNIAQKWGFGMSPIKPKTQSKRFEHIDNVLELLESGRLDTDFDPNHISEVKGLFNRIWRMDQWDWFNVFELMDRPGAKHSQDIGSALTDLRNSITGKGVGNQELAFKFAHEKLESLKTRMFLRNYRQGIVKPPDKDQIYILSTRELPNYLKIGWTSRSVTERVKEINSATGVLIPFGVRAVWHVPRGQGIELERKIHRAMSNNRVRSDREFFNLEFGQAFKISLDIVRNANF